MRKRGTSVDSQTTCRCSSPPFSANLFVRIELGLDDRHAEVSLDTCVECGQLWLHFLIEEEHHSRSGRWWRVPLNSPGEISLPNARTFLEQQPMGL